MKLGVKVPSEPARRKRRLRGQTHKRQTNTVGQRAVSRSNWISLLSGLPSSALCLSLFWLSAVSNGIQQPGTTTTTTTTPWNGLQEAKNFAVLWWKWLLLIVWLKAAFNPNEAQRETWDGAATEHPAACQALWKCGWTVCFHQGPAESLGAVVGSVSFIWNKQASLHPAVLMLPGWDTQSFHTVWVITGDHNYQCLWTLLDIGKVVTTAATTADIFIDSFFFSPSD